MQALVVEFQIRPERVDEFHAAIVDNARASRETEAGCRQFDVCRDPADRQRFILYELYDDEAAVQAHLQTPHFIDMDRRTRPWVLGKTVRQLRRVEP